jgi:hypothetical protein
MVLHRPVEPAAETGKVKIVRNHTSPVSLATYRELTQENQVLLTQYLRVGLRGRRVEK